MPKKNLNEFSEPGQLPPRPIKEPRAVPCEDTAEFRACDGIENLTHAPNAPFQGLDDDILNKKDGLGEANFCDPMLVGKIVDDPAAVELPPDRSVIYRYAKGLRSIDEAVKKLFLNIDVIDDLGKVFTVPVMWGSQERVVAFILQNNVRKDNTGVVDRITLPMISIYTSDYSFPAERFIYHKAVDYKRGLRHTDNRGLPVGDVAGSPSWVHREQFNNDTVLGVARGIPVNMGYTLTIWTSFWEDMNQILEQIAMKFNPLAYIQLQGVTNWESTVRIDSVANNLDVEPGDKNKRVFKFQINLTAESYLPQPIVRRKAVLKTRVEIVDSIDTSKIQSVIARIEEAVGELDV